MLIILIIPLQLFISSLTGLNSNIKDSHIFKEYLTYLCGNSLIKVITKSDITMKLSELSQKIQKANNSLKEFSDSCNELSKTMLRSAGIKKEEKTMYVVQNVAV